MAKNINPEFEDLPMGEYLHYMDLAELLMNKGLSNRPTEELAKQIYNKKLKEGNT
jgi:hypothetical protein